MNNAATWDSPQGPGVLGRFMADVMQARGAQTKVPNSCGRCGATAYKSLMARDDAGVMRASGQYQCVQCRRVFSSLSEWRGAESQN